MLHADVQGETVNVQCNFVKKYCNLSYSSAGSQYTGSSVRQISFLSSQSRMRPKHFVSVNATKSLSCRSVQPQFFLIKLRIYFPYPYPCSTSPILHATANYTWMHMSTVAWRHISKHDSTCRTKKRKSSFTAMQIFTKSHRMNSNTGER